MAAPRRVRSPLNPVLRSTVVAAWLTGALLLGRLQYKYILPGGSSQRVPRQGTAVKATLAAQQPPTPPDQTAAAPPSRTMSAADTLSGSEAEGWELPSPEAVLSSLAAALLMFAMGYALSGLVEAVQTQPWEVAVGGTTAVFTGGASAVMAVNRGMEQALPSTDVVEAIGSLPRVAAAAAAAVGSASKEQERARSPPPSPSAIRSDFQRALDAARASRPGPSAAPPVAPPRPPVSRSLARLSRGERAELKQLLLSTPVLSQQGIRS